jgi:hypothetical protein
VIGSGAGCVRDEEGDDELHDLGGIDAVK